MQIEATCGVACANVFTVLMRGILLTSRRVPPPPGIMRMSSFGTLANVVSAMTTGPALLAIGPARSAIRTMRIRSRTLPKHFKRSEHVEQLEAVEGEHAEDHLVVSLGGDSMRVCSLHFSDARKGQHCRRQPDIHHDSTARRTLARHSVAHVISPIMFRFRVASAFSLSTAIWRSSRNAVACTGKNCRLVIPTQPNAADRYGVRKSG